MLVSRHGANARYASYTSDKYSCLSQLSPNAPEVPLDRPDDRASLEPLASVDPLGKYYANRLCEFRFRQDNYHVYAPISCPPQDTSCVKCNSTQQQSNVLTIQAHRDHPDLLDRPDRWDAPDQTDVQETPETVETMEPLERPDLLEMVLTATFQF